MDKKIYTPTNLSTNQHPEPHHLIQETLLEEEFSSEISILQNQKLMPRPEGVEALLNKINRKTLEGQY